VDDFQAGKRYVQPLRRRRVYRRDFQAVQFSVLPTEAYCIGSAATNSRS
jgi:hypothetical protein